MLTEGMYIADRYEIVGKVGAGGMSDVYKAKDHILGRFVAIKVLKQEFSEDVNFVTKFRTEAQSAAGLEHPNIVNIYDVGSENGMHYIVMEFIEGITLKTYIEKKGRLTFKEAVSIAIQVGRGIEAAHNKNIVHRDIKPQNIIISTEGKVKVTDFGIARAATSNTINSDVMGSVHYSSPEQARNGFVDGKSDIYSLGIVMYEMVTGRVPFDGDTTVAVAIQHLQEEMVPPSSYTPDLPVSFEKIILKCTQKNPDRRYENMGELLVDLRKSLISPNEDFVTMVPLENNGKTRIVEKDELEAIRQSAGKVSGDTEDESESGVDEEDEEEGFLNPNMEKAMTIGGIVAAVIIVAIIVCLVGNLMGVLHFGGSNRDGDTETETEIQTETAVEGDTVTMIDLLGMTFEEAQDAIEDAGIDITIKEGDPVSSDDYEEGEIAYQSVEAGAEVTEGSTVTVRVSSGSGDITIKDVAGYKSSEAKQLLEDQGFVVSFDYDYDENVQQDYVIKTTPDAGTSAKKGDTVTVIISRGLESIQVPDLAGYSETDAMNALTEKGLNYNKQTDYSDTVAEGLVISTDPVAGKFVDKGTTVTLTISQGKKSVYYSYHSDALTAPEDGNTYTGGKVTLTSETGEVLWTTTFTGTNPGKVSVSNISGSSSGTLTIDWNYTDADGNSGVTTVSQGVTFTEQ
ncbi:MAG: Stk1 family PASTA domain-containing Ser/Thr kinase [Roseburia sp.]